MPTPATFKAAHNQPAQIERSLVQPRCFRVDNGSRHLTAHKRSLGNSCELYLAYRAIDAVARPLPTPSRGVARRRLGQPSVRAETHSAELDTTLHRIEDKVVPGALEKTHPSSSDEHRPRARSALPYRRAA